MKSKATTVAQYLLELPPDRREALEGVRKTILSNLDRDFEEGIQYGMIGYYVPHSIYPAGYHCDPTQPLPFAALGSQKNYMSLHLMCIYGENPLAKKFRDGWLATGKKLDMGKACIRFKKLEDLALDVIGETLRSVTARRYIEHCQTAVQRSAGRTGARGSGKPAAARRSASAKNVTSRRVAPADKKASTKRKR